MSDTSKESKKIKFHWARIGDGNYEPVAVSGKRGKRKAWTIGCGDPFEVDVPDSAIFLEESEFYEMLPPLTPKQEANAERRERAAQRAMKSHSYAGFGRKQSNEGE
jgi:hypothetical protein